MITTSPATTSRRLPVGIWALGFVSLLMDISSEMIHGLLPIYLVTIMGASTLMVGVIEGAAEATALITKVFSGVLSDYLGKRKGLAILGYGLAATTKPIFALAPGISWILGARLLDRVGKGIRGAPRDALIADLTPSDRRGAAYGLRQALDTVGAFLGPLLAIGLMFAWANDFQRVFWVAALPAALAVVLLTVAVKEPEHKDDQQRHNPISRANLRRLSAHYWWVVLVGAIFTLARFSEAFLLLRAAQGGLAVTWLPLVLVVMNIAYALSAYPFGKLADRVSHRRLLMLGLAMLIVADLILAQADYWLWTMAGAICWGIHMGMTQGLLATMIATQAPASLRGTAFGFFNVICGIAMLLASVIAGALWQWLGPAQTFYAGALFCLLAAVTLTARRLAAEN